MFLHGFQRLLVRKGGGQVLSQKSERERETAERFYDKMRRRVDRWLATHTGDRYQDYRRFLFLVPDVLTLVLRLARDPRVPTLNRLQLWGTAAYILAPVDLNLDFILPLGPLDDLALAVGVLSSVLNTTPPDVLRDNWPGDDDVMEVLSGLIGGLGSLRRLLGWGQGAPGRRGWRGPRGRR